MGVLVVPRSTNRGKHLKGKDRQERDLIPFFSPKALKVKERATERAKANRPKAKESEAKAARANKLKVEDAHLKTRATSASSQGITRLNAPSLRPSLPRLGMSASEPNCPTKRSTSTICLRIRWAWTSVATVSAANATGRHVHLQSSLFFFMRLQGVSSMTACGTWSPRRSQAIPLCPKKCFYRYMDKRTIAGRMRTARMEIMATRKRTLLKRATDSAATWQMWNLCLSSFL